MSEDKWIHLNMGDYGDAALVFHQQSQRNWHEAAQVIHDIKEVARAEGRREGRSERPPRGQRQRRGLRPIRARGR